MVAPGVLNPGNINIPDANPGNLVFLEMNAYKTLSIFDLPNG
jgi:hypothetical protein